MNERNQRIVRLVESGKKFKEISEEYGISYERVRQIYRSCRCKNQERKRNAEVFGDWGKEFSRGLANALLRNGISSEKELYKFIESGRCLRNVGAKKIEKELNPVLEKKLEYKQGKIAFAEK